MRGCEYLTISRKYRYNKADCFDAKQFTSSQVNRKVISSEKAQSDKARFEVYEKSFVYHSALGKIEMIF